MLPTTEMIEILLPLRPFHWNPIGCTNIIGLNGALTLLTSALDKYPLDIIQCIGVDDYNVYQCYAISAFDINQQIHTW